MSFTIAYRGHSQPGPGPTIDPDPLPSTVTLTDIAVEESINCTWTSAFGGYYIGDDSLDGENITISKIDKYNIWFINVSNNQNGYGSTSLYGDYKHISNYGDIENGNADNVIWDEYSDYRVSP